MKTWETYGPDIGRDEDDNGKRAKPGVSDGEKNIARYLRSMEVFKRQNYNSHRQRQGDHVEHPHLCFSFSRKVKNSQQDYDSSVLLNDHFDSPLGSPGTSDVINTGIVETYYGLWLSTSSAYYISF
ncbi:hypothetical protein CsatA_014190 [Cannabis sativa]